MNQQKTKTTYMIPAAIAAALALAGVQIVQAENESTFVTGDILTPAKRCLPAEESVKFN